MKTFLDTNVLVCWLDAGPRADLVERLLAGDAVISVQVLNEFTNVLRKKRGTSLATIRELVDTLLQTCEVCDSTVRIHRAALDLAARYKLGIYDASILAAAGESGCVVVYSEDMHRGMSIRMPKSLNDGILSIRNPFL